MNKTASFAFFRPSLLSGAGWHWRLARQWSTDIDRAWPLADKPPVPPYAVNRSISVKNTPSPSRVPRPRLCVGVRIGLTFEDTPTPSRGRGTHGRQKGLTA